MKTKQKIMSLVLAMVMCFSLCVPAFAATPDDENLPIWVEEGEDWFPANGIMPLEDFGNCPKGHTGPSGYTYQGYTMGQSTGHYDSFAEVISFVSAVSDDLIIRSVTSLSAAVLRWLAKHEDPDLTYFKYVYTKGSSTFYHVIYTINQGGGEYTYLTCETYYG